MSQTWVASISIRQVPSQRNRQEKLAATSGIHRGSTRMADLEPLGMFTQLIHLEFGKAG